ncbi:MAG: DivIVA domain-containing protein [Acidimicrobiia bacterium]|nr:DivIVA domain-containing protein [Acidimicrobiia bacterium]
MADQVGPESTRAPRFDTARKGYDRDQVDTHLAAVDERIAELERRVEDVRTDVLAIGIDDREALANELNHIGGEVGSILEAARETAEGLRRRASADADRWRTEARSDADDTVRSAREQSQSMRAAAWNEGSSLLSSAAAEAKAIAASAQEDALFMRAEAERDALRLTSDAKRDRDEALRSARQEAESIVEEARRESDGVLAAAQKQAEVAQERARALEDRRSELLKELEATRDSISALEHEIDSRRQELETPEPEPEPERPHHEGDVGSVRIVAGSRARTLKPVDPDELVAEVAAMRAGTSPSSAVAPEPPREPETVTVIAPPVAPVVDVEPEQEPVVEPPPGGPDPVSSEAPTDAADAPDTPNTIDTAEVASVDEIGSLFARLRADGSTPDPNDEVPEPTEPSTPSTPLASGPATSEATVDGPAPAASTEPTPDTEVAVEAARDDRPSDEAIPDGADVLAVRNQALKEIKRVLVELQNETLEALRVDESWVPEPSFTDRFTGAFEMLGSSSNAGDGAAASSGFAADLHDSLRSAIERERDAGKGGRAVASAASKVFRTWRSDEAERRIRPR